MTDFLFLGDSPFKNSNSTIFACFHAPETSEVEGSQMYVCGKPT